MDVHNLHNDRLPGNRRRKIKIGSQLSSYVRILVAQVRVIFVPFALLFRLHSLLHQFEHFELPYVYQNVHYKGCSLLYVTEFTFSVLIKICAKASKFYSFLRTSISIYRKKWKSDVYGVPSRASKSFAYPSLGGGKKCCRRVSWRL